MTTDGLRTAIYADCPEEDIVLSELCLVPQSAAAAGAPVIWTDERYGRVARAYIECTEDNAVSLKQQRAMLAGEFGPARQWAIRHQMEVGAFFDAPDLVPVGQAHIMADTEAICRSRHPCGPVSSR